MPNYNEMMKQMEKQCRVPLPMGQCANLNVSQFSNINAHKSVQHVPHKIPDNAKITVKRLESKMQLTTYSFSLV